MTKTNQRPIFCDECASLALAVLDGAPLCANCLRQALKNGSPNLKNKIAPLAFEWNPSHASTPPGNDNSSEPGFF